MEILERYTLFDSVLPSTTGIYRIINLINGKYYIGSARSQGGCPSRSGFRIRVAKHRWDLQFNRHHSEHLQRCYNKVIRNGLDPNDVFEIQILQHVEPNFCLEVEDFYLKKYKPSYNGRLNTVSEQERAFNRKEKALKEKVPKYVGVSPAGEYIKFMNARQFCRDNPKFNLTAKGISACIIGQSKSHRGWQFFYWKDYQSIEDIPILAKRSYIAISPSGLVFEFSNAAAFVRSHPEYKLDKTHVSKCVLGLSKSHRGWQFFSKEYYEINKNEISALKINEYVGVSPWGEVYLFSNIRAFARDNPKHKFYSTTISACIKGKIKIHRGWKFYRAEDYYKSAA